MNVNDRVFYCRDYEQMRGVTALNRAIHRGHLGIVRELLKHHDLNVNADEPLIYSCRFGRLDIVRELLQYKDLDVNALYKGGAYSFVRNHGTALMVAVIRGHLDIVCELLKRQDLDVNVNDDRHHTPLMQAYENDHWDIFGNS
ncbi:hypothetical protein MHU86_4718 [Fragilaria crotonensis]|nr:hypothetical protein MHU86_4718 [Fragilaria crotonensis]